MTKSLNIEIKEAAAPWIKVFADCIKAARAQGMTDKQLAGLMEEVERDTAWISPDAHTVLVGELRKSIGLK
jgi:hypothetical protein